MQQTYTEEGDEVLVNNVKSYSKGFGEASLLVERSRWNERLHEGIKRQRFRRNPIQYLKDIESKACALIGQS
jgi:hypothetical protein